MNLKNFAKQHDGLKLIVRRHLQSRKAPLFGLVDDSAALAIRLGRNLNDQLQGLSAQGTANAFQQGVWLAQMGVFPDVIICGTDQRNIDGAEATAEGITSIDKKRNTPFYRSPGLTYPYYANMKVVAEVHRQFGDNGFLRHICGCFPETAGFWSEPVTAFKERLVAAVDALCHQGSEFGLELWDLNYEQMAVLFQVVVRKDLLSEMTLDETAYECDYGAGFIICVDGTITEFNAQMEIAASAKPKKK